MFLCSILITVEQKKSELDISEREIGKGLNETSYLYKLSFLILDKRNRMSLFLGRSHFKTSVVIVCGAEVF